MKVFGILVFLLAISTAKIFKDEEHPDEKYKSWFKKEKDKFDRKKESWFNKGKGKSYQSNHADGNKYQSYKGNQFNSDRGNLNKATKDKYSGGHPSFGNKFQDLLDFDFWNSDEYSGPVREIPSSPVCPIKVNIIEDLEVVSPTVYSQSYVNQNFVESSVVFETVTKTYPVTFVETVFSTYYDDPILYTESIIRPIKTTATTYLPVYATKLFLETEVQISTFLMTSLLTHTNYVPIYDTVTEYGTVSVYSTVAYYSTRTEWQSQTVTVTQPISITTKLYIQAPQLSVLTSTITDPHYMTTVVEVTDTIYETICNKNKGKAGKGKRSENYEKSKHPK